MSGGMRIGSVTVSRKTAGDGKLAVPGEVVDRLLSLGAEFPVRVEEIEARASISSMPCAKGCGGEGGDHRHWFLESDAFRRLAVDATYALVINENVAHLSLVSAA